MADFFSSYFPQDTKVMIGFSCGSDSVFLLHHLLQYLPSSHILLVYCDHGLRPAEIEQEKVFLKKIALDYGIQYRVRRIPVERMGIRKKMSLETAGRTLRYRLFHHLARLHQIPIVLTAHHSDDVVETSIHHVLRGALKPPQISERMVLSEKVMLIRPLLSVSKRDILTKLQELKLEWMHDSSNNDVSFTRNKIRHQVIPLLKEINPQASQHVLQFMSHYHAIYHDVLSELLCYLDRLCFGSDVVIPFSIFKEVSELKMGILCREILNRLDYLSLSDSSFLHIQDLVHLGRFPRAGKKVQLLSGYFGVCEYDGVRIGRITTSAKFNVAVTDLPSEVMIPEVNIRVTFSIEPRLNLGDYRSSKTACCMDADLLDLSAFVIRNRLEGDYFHPYLKSQPVKLSRYFIEKKVPQGQRDMIPLFFNRDALVWVSGFAISDCVKITPETKTILTISMQSL